METAKIFIIGLISLLAISVAVQISIHGTAGYAIFDFFNNEEQTNVIEPNYTNPYEEFVSSPVLNRGAYEYCGPSEIATPINAIASDDNSDLSVFNTVDLDPNTHWFGSAESEFPKWVYLDLGERKCISEIDIYVFKRDLPQTVDIQVSNSDLQWSTVKKDLVLDKTSNVGIELKKTILARNVRIVIKDSARSFGSISDIRLNVSSFSEEILGLNL